MWAAANYYYKKLGKVLAKCACFYNVQVKKKKWTKFISIVTTKQYYPSKLAKETREPWVPGYMIAMKQLQKLLMLMWETWWNGKILFYLPAKMC